MSTLNYLIVELDKAYDNEVDLGDNKTLIVNSTIESIESIVRVAKVVESPSFVIINEGDDIIAHHNIFRKKNDVNGNQTKGDYYLGGGKYFVPLTEVFMYDSGLGWNALDPFVFIKPIPFKEDETALLSGLEKDYKGMEHQKGIVAFNNKALRAQGLETGCKVSFSKYSEHEFKIEGEIYYKMKTKDILAIL